MEICEVGEAGKARLRQPPDSEKAHRFMSADREPVLGWRPAIDQAVPGTGWVLEKKLGEGSGIYRSVMKRWAIFWWSKASSRMRWRPTSKIWRS